MWLLDRMKTNPHQIETTITERCAILNILDQNRNCLNNLNLDLITSVLLDNTNDILQHILLQKESVKELATQRDTLKQYILKVRITLLLSVNHDFCQLTQHLREFTISTNSRNIMQSDDLSVQFSLDYFVIKRNTSCASKKDLASV